MHIHTHKIQVYALYNKQNVIIQNNLMAMIKQILTYRNQEYNINSSKMKPGNPTFTDKRVNFKTLKEKIISQIYNLVQKHKNYEATQFHLMKLPN